MRSSALSKLNFCGGGEQLLDIAGTSRSWEGFWVSEREKRIFQSYDHKKCGRMKRCGLNSNRMGAEIVRGAEKLITCRIWAGFGALERENLIFQGYDHGEVERMKCSGYNSNRMGAECVVESASLIGQNNGQQQGQQHYVALPVHADINRKAIQMLNRVEEYGVIGSPNAEGMRKNRKENKKDVSKSDKIFI